MEKTWNKYIIINTNLIHVWFKASIPKRVPHLLCLLRISVGILTAGPSKHGWRKCRWRRRWEHFIRFTCHFGMASGDRCTGDWGFRSCTLWRCVLMTSWPWNASGKCAMIRCVPPSAVLSHVAETRRLVAGLYYNVNTALCLFEKKMLLTTTCATKPLNVIFSTILVDFSIRFASLVMLPAGRNSRLNSTWPFWVRWRETHTHLYAH